MVFLKRIALPKDKERTYPYGVPSIGDISAIDFSKITIFAGSNGCGKSTLLNVIAKKLGAQQTLGNHSGSFEWFTDHCECKFALDEHYNLIAPVVCKLIKSEDIMGSIINVRKGNVQIGKQSAFGKKFADSNSGEFGYADLAGTGKRDEELTNSERFMRSRLSDYNKAERLENLKKQEYSNGETALQYFMETMLDEDSLYLLDEPENSLSPALQFELKNFLENAARFCNCQIIIATHSPFLLSINKAKIYDLDNIPVRVKNFYELENMKAYAKLFFEYKKEFDAIE